MQEVARGRHVGFGWVVVLVGLVYVVGARFSGPEPAFWSPDSSIRYVQLVSLLRQRYEEVAAVYPGAWLDPEAQFYPVSKGFAAPLDGKVYCSIRPSSLLWWHPSFRLRGLRGS